MLIFKEKYFAISHENEYSSSLYNEKEVCER
jgi:hypothetical protein